MNKLLGIMDLNVSLDSNEMKGFEHLQKSEKSCNYSIISESFIRSQSYSNGFPTAMNGRRLQTNSEKLG